LEIFLVERAQFGLRHLVRACYTDADKSGGLKFIKQSLSLKAKEGQKKMCLDRRQAQKSSMRINWRRLTGYVMFMLIAPTLAAVVLDQIIATSPWLTIVVSLICIPATTVVVMRTALLEFEKIIEVVAPVEREMEKEEGANLKTGEPSPVDGAE
jgi:F0F1-type ATP synthase assembly protein I